MRTDRSVSTVEDFTCRRANPAPYTTFNLMTIKCQSSQSCANPMSINCMSDANPMLIPWQSNINPRQIWCQSKANNLPSLTTRTSIQCQSSANLIPIQCQSDPNPTPIHCQSISTQVNQPTNIPPPHTFTNLPIHLQSLTNPRQSSTIVVNPRQSVRTYQVYLKELVL